jgi:diguanylate cyclase
VKALIARTVPRWSSLRFRITVYAILAGIFAGAVNLFLPLEDLNINVRSELLKRDVPQDIVVIGVDDATLAALQANDVSRADDAKLIGKLMDAGVERVYFDRRFRFEGNAEADAAFIAALKQHRGKVFLPVGAAHDANAGDTIGLMPAKQFSDNSELIAVSGLYHPFGLMISFPLQWDTVAGKLPSMSASLADREAPTPAPRWLKAFVNEDEGFFRADYSYNIDTIPTVSYADVLEGRFDPEQFAGKRVIVGLISESFKDVYGQIFKGAVPGVYFHVLSAHTFRQPYLLNLGWLPALVLVSLLLASGMRRGRAFDRYRIAGLVLIIGVAPAALNHVGIDVEIMPAIFTALVAVIRSRSLDRVQKVSETNATSGLPSLQMLRALPSADAGSMIALKLRNYGAIVASFENPVEARLANEIARRIRLGDPEATVYHEGDKFVWLSPICNPVEIFEHLEGLHRLVQSGLAIEGRDIDLSFNCGVETARNNQIERRLANALQSAEQAVRNDELVCIYDPSTDEVQWEISLLSALDRAIDSGEVWVAYQSKLDLKTGEIIGAEALARWTHPERGPISPDKFIQIAEEYHRIDRITRFVLAEAVRTAREMRAHIPDFKMSVNISAQLLRYAGLPDMIAEALRAQQMPPECLVLEITETDRLDRSSGTHAMMQRLVAAGHELSIDDFGTGNATIDYLRFLPAVEVKIDKVFITAITSDRKDHLLVQSIIEMAHSLDRRVVAEGVENEEIMQTLRKLGCDQAQGYHISRPIRDSELFLMLARSKATKAG